MKSVTMHGPLFPQYIQPKGWLTSDIPCHGLFYYAICMQKNLDTIAQGNLAYEGDADHGFNFQQLMTTIATMYGCSPDTLIKFWTNVDMQFFLLNYKKIPEMYRMNKVPEIRTQ